MSALFYVWDPKQHNPQTTISTLEQAEYFATNSQEIGFSENLKNWLLDVEQIVTKPELVDNFDEEIIQFFSNVKGFFNFSTNVFVIEYLQEKSKYLYKILVETLRKHNLVAFDAKHYVFFSQDVIFPDQKSLEQMLSSVEAVSKEQLLQFKAIPENGNKLTIFAREWLKLNKNDLNFKEINKKNQFNEVSNNCREFNLHIYEGILILCINKKNTLAYEKVSLSSYIQVTKNKAIRIYRQHYIDGYNLQYLPSLHGITGEPNHFIYPEQLQYVLQQIYDFLIYDAKKHSDPKTLNEWLNHGDEKEYITGLGAISRLVLAKYVNDPFYDQLVEEALPYVNRNRFFKNMSFEQFKERLEKEIKDILEK